MSANVDMLTGLAAAIRAAVGEHADWGDTAGLVATALERHLPAPTILTPEQRAGDADTYRTEVLHSEHALRDTRGARPGVQGRPPERRRPRPGDVERPHASGVRQRKHRHRHLPGPRDRRRARPRGCTQGAPRRAPAQVPSPRLRGRDPARSPRRRGVHGVPARDRTAATRLVHGDLPPCRLRTAVRNESFHTGWDLGVLAEIPAVAMAPQTVAGGLPEGIVAVAISEPTDSLETCLVWRADDASPAVASFVQVARSTLTSSV